MEEPKKSITIKLKEINTLNIKKYKGDYNMNSLATLGRLLIQQLNENLEKELEIRNLIKKNNSSSNNLDISSGSNSSKKEKGNKK